jgi:hypothetical protein
MISVAADAMLGAAASCVALCLVPVPHAIRPTQPVAQREYAPVTAG